MAPATGANVRLPGSNASLTRQAPGLFLPSRSCRAARNSDVAMLAAMAPASALPRQAARQIMVLPLFGRRGREVTLNLILGRHTVGV